MLGKHVNVSARNQKLLKKILCAFMAIVLVGLMIPHGVVQYNNAFANDEATTEEQAASEEQAEPQVSDPQVGDVTTASEVNAAEVPQNDGEIITEENPVSNGTIHFFANTEDGKLPEGMAFKFLNGDYSPTWETLDFPHDADTGVGGLDRVLPGGIGYECRITRYNSFGDRLYYGIERQTEQARQLYTLDHWEYSNEKEGTYTPLTASVDVGKGDFYLKLIIKDNFKVDFQSNLGELGFPSTDIECYKKTGETYSAVDLTKPIYVKEETHFSNVDPGEGYDGGLKIGDDIYCFKMKATAAGYANYDYKEWQFKTPSEGWSGVTPTGADITSAVSFRADFKVRVEFVANDSTMGEVKCGSKTGDYYDPVSGITKGDNDNELVIVSQKYVATAFDGYEFIHWSANVPCSEIGVLPLTVTASFGQKPAVTLTLDEGLADYLTINDSTGTALQLPYTVEGLNVGSTFKLGDDKTKVAFDEKSNLTFATAITELGAHYVFFDSVVWYIKGDTPGTDIAITEEPYTLQDAENLTLVAKVGRLDNLRVSGKICDTTTKAALAGASYRYEVFIGSDMVANDVKETSDGNFVIENLPHNCKVDIYAHAPNHSANKITVNVDTGDKTEQDVSLDNAYSFEYGNTTDSGWWDSRGFNNIRVVFGGLIDSGQGYYYTPVSTGATLKVKANAGDTLRFVSLNKASVSNKSLRVGNQSEVQWKRYYSTTLTSNDIDSDGDVTIMFSGEIDFISNTATPRTISFASDSAWKGTGSFDPAGPITLDSLFATASVDPDNKSKLIITDGDTTKTITATANNTDNPSIFRQWNIEGTLKIGADTTITAKFVLANVKLTFIPASNSQFAKGSDTSTGALGPFSIPMDSAFGYERTDLLTAKPYTQVGDVKTDIVTMNVKDDQKYQYKFADASFNPETITKIDEVYEPDIETDGLTIEYKIIQKISKTIYLDYTEGATPADQYIPPAIPTEYGSTREGGAWRHQQKNHRWVNYIYEGFPIKAIEQGGPALINYFPTDWTKIQKDHLFFNGTWSGPSEGFVTEETTWTANYDEAVYVSGTVTDTKGAPISGIDVKISTRDGSAIDPTNVSSRTVLADSSGKYELMLYCGKDLRIELGDSTHICQSADIDNVASDTTQNFVLEDGYSWVPGGFSSGSWTAEYGATQTWTSSDASATASEVKLPENKLLTYAKSNVLKPGDKIVVEASGATSVTVNNGYDDTVTVTDGKFEYTVWNATEDLTFKPNGADLFIYRIDYHLTDKSLLTYSGRVTEADGTTPIADVHVKFEFSQANADPIETDTNDGGNYHLLLPATGAKGTISYVKDHHLDIKEEVNVTQSVTNADEKLDGAWEISGKIRQQKPGTEEYVAAEGVQMSFTNTEAYSWPVYTLSDGTYTLKIKKGASGSMIPYKAGYAEDGRTYTNLSEDKNNVNIDLHIAGAIVDVKGIAPGHEKLELHYYDHGIDYLQQIVTDTVPTVFAQDGKFSCGYDAYGNHILKYDFPSDDFQIILIPVANEGYTFWSWSYTDAAGNRKVLNDNTEEIGPLASNVKYTFNVDYAESSDVTIGTAASEGHNGWKMTVLVNNVNTYEQTLAADESITFGIPKQQTSSNAEESINSDYSFDGQSFVINMDSVFGESKTPYNEKRIFTPIPADGYQLDGIVVNNSDLPLYTAYPIGDDPLNVLAKYSLIPVNVNAQTGDSLDFGWLIVIAILGAAGVGFALYRRHKCSRSRK